MSIILKNNAYHVLGLDTMASQKDIFKRSKEIIKRLEIDDLPKYDLDLGLFDNFRIEELVKEATQKLQTPKKQIKEYFFWFQIADDIDEQVLRFIKSKKYKNALQLWETASEGESAKAYLYKKNLAILYLLLLINEENKEYLQDSLLLWKAVIDSEKFWNYFSKIYKLHDEQTTSQEIVVNFRSNISGYLADIYTELHQLYEDPIYINEFQKVFSIKSEKIEKKILSPAYTAINESVEKLENMNVSEDGMLDEQERKEIKELLELIQLEFNKLIDLGFHNDGQIKKMGDRAANGVRTIVLDIHNNLEDIEFSKNLLRVAIAFGGTESFKAQLEQELAQIEENIKHENEDKVSLEIKKFFKTNYLTFENKSVEYKKKRISYKDVTGISWYATKNSTNGVQTGSKYNFNITSEKDNIEISFSGSYSGEDQAEENFGKIAGISSGIMGPIIIKRFISEIFDKKATVTISSLNFNNRGIYKKKLFGGIEEILWSDIKDMPELDQGEAVVYKENKKGEAEAFEIISMSINNAVLIPELSKECLKQNDYYGK